MYAVRIGLLERENKSGLILTAAPTHFIEGEGPCRPSPNHGSVCEACLPASSSQLLVGSTAVLESGYQKPGFKEGT